MAAPPSISEGPRPQDANRTPQLRWARRASREDGEGTVFAVAVGAVIAITSLPLPPPSPSSSPPPHTPIGVGASPRRAARSSPSPQEIPRADNRGRRLLPATTTTTTASL
ncbi:hypothetical protein C8R44DRAFT_895065 [Mycena epipterygia]|nr:hypothetical protein C8R44DRAFT_895065 [Mycena epipterygia]